MKTMRRTTGAMIALALAGCSLSSNDEATGVANSALTLQITGPLSARGVDPTTLHGTTYEISIAGIETVTTANSNTDVYHVDGGPNNPNFTNFLPADPLRVDFGAVLERNGALITNPANPITCQVGDIIDGGDLGQNIFTRQGSIYTQCAGPLASPEMRGKAIGLSAPVEVQLGDTLDLYTRLSVLDAGDVWVKASDPNDGFGGELVGVGGAFSQGASIISALGFSEFGSALSTVGTVLSKVGQVAQGTQVPAHAVCKIPNSLIPGVGSNDTPDDTVAPMLRTQLTGRELYEKTANGDAALLYDLDFRPSGTSSFCQRPRTKIAFRIRRVTMSGVPGAPVTSVGGSLIAPYPDELDAFSIDTNANVVHDQRANRYWSTGTPIPSWRYSYGGGGAGLWSQIFPAKGNIVGISKSPGQTDTFGIDVNGDLVSNWRANGYDNGAWHDWNNLTNAGKLPPGAPVAVVSRYPSHLDVFVVANDGSLFTEWWDACCGWDPNGATLMPAGSVTPYDGEKFGGVTAAARTNENLDVAVIGNDYKLWVAYWSGGNGWAFAPTLSPSDTWAYSGTPIASASLTGSRLDFFWVNMSGNVVTQWWDGVNWSDHLVQVTSSAYPIARWGSVAVVARKVDVKNDPMADNQHMDVFAIGVDGHVLHVPWAYGMDNFSWNAAHTEVLGAVAESTGTISAIAPWAGSIQVAARKSDGTTTKTWYEDVEPSNIVWQSVP